MSDDYLGTRSLFRLACLEVFRDGQVDEPERELLKRLQQALRIPPEAAQGILAEARTYCLENPSPEAGPLEPETLFDLASQLAWADGELEDREQKILLALGQVLALEPARCQEILARHRPDLRQEVSISIPDLALEPAAPPPPEPPPPPGLVDLPPRPRPDPAPRTFRPPSPPDPELGVAAAQEATRGGVLGWISGAVGLQDPWIRKARNANGWLDIARTALVEIAASGAPRGFLAGQSRQLLREPGVQRDREAARPNGLTACPDNLGNDGLVVSMRETLASAATKDDPRTRLLVHQMCLWYALDVLHAPAGTYARLRPQYEYLAELVEAARRDVPDRIPPLMVRILWYLARDLAASGEDTGGVAERLGRDMCLGAEVVRPAGHEDGSGEGEYRYADLVYPARDVLPALIQLDQMDRAEHLRLRSFPVFAAAVALGFERVGYTSYVRPDGSMMWITEEHARMIGRALRPGLRAFHLDLTMFAPGAAAALAEATPPGLQLDELVFSHKSGDEVCAEEATGLAALAHRVDAEVVRIWAGEFDADSMEAFAAELERRGNTSVVEVDSCDVNRPEPDDRFDDPAVAAITARNRRLRSG